MYEYGSAMIRFSRAPRNPAQKFKVVHTGGQVTLGMLLKTWNSTYGYIFRTADISPKKIAEVVSREPAR